jgi:type II secretory pathway component PulL
MKSDAQRDRVLHVVIERTSLRRTLHVLNTYAQRAAKRVTIARTVQLLNVIHDAKHAAAQTIETLAASHALSTSAQNAKARWIQRGTIRTTAPRYKAQSVHSAKKLVMTKSDAQRDRVLHVVIERTSLRRTLNVLNTYAQHAAKNVTITRIAPPVNKSISATGHSARECPSKTVSICNSCGDAAHQQHSYPSYAQR